jgi:hypothetical protein
MPYRDPNNTNYFIALIILFKDVFLGVIGGAISYLFDFSKARRNGTTFAFQLSSMFINMALGGFVAYLIGTILESDMQFRDAIIGISGVTSYQILLLAESKFAIWIFNKITGETSTKNERKD